MSNEQRLRKNFYDAEPFNEISVFGPDDVEMDGTCPQSGDYVSRPIGRIVARMPDLDEQDELEQPATIPFQEAPENEFPENSAKWDGEDLNPPLPVAKPRLRQRFYNVGQSIRNGSRPARRAFKRFLTGSAALVSGQARNLGIAVVLCIVAALMWGAFGPRDRDHITEDVAYKAVTEDSEKSKEGDRPSGDKAGQEKVDAKTPKPEATKPPVPKLEEKKPEAPKPPATKPEEKEPETPKPQTPKPEEKKPEAPKPQPPKQETAPPAPELSQNKAVQEPVKPDSPWARQPDSNYFPWGMASTRDHDPTRIANENRNPPDSEESVETLPPPNMDSIHSIFGMESGQVAVPEGASGNANLASATDNATESFVPMGFAGYVPPENISADETLTNRESVAQGTQQAMATHQSLPPVSSAHPPQIAMQQQGNYTAVPNASGNGQMPYPQQYVPSGSQAPNAMLSSTTPPGMQPPRTMPPQNMVPLAPHSGPSTPLVQYLPAPERQRIAVQESPQTFRSHPQSIPTTAPRDNAALAQYQYPQTVPPQTQANQANPAYLAHAAQGAYGQQAPRQTAIQQQPQYPIPQQQYPLQQPNTQQVALPYPAQSQYPAAQQPSQSQGRPYQPPLAEAWTPSQAPQATQQGMNQGYQTVPPVNANTSNYPAGSPTLSPGVALPSTPGYY